MVAAELDFVKALHTVIPADIPALPAHGTYADELGKQFYLSVFFDMGVELPSASEFVSITIQLH